MLVEGEVMIPLFKTGTLNVSTSPGIAANPMIEFKLTVLLSRVRSTVTPAELAIKSTA